MKKADNFSPSGVGSVKSSKSLRPNSDGRGTSDRAFSGILEG